MQDDRSKHDPLSGFVDAGKEPCWVLKGILVRDVTSDSGFGVRTPSLGSRFIRLFEHFSIKIASNVNSYSSHSNTSQEVR